MLDFTQIKDSFRAILKGVLICIISILVIAGPIKLIQDRTNYEIKFIKHCEDLYEQGKLKRFAMETRLNEDGELQAIWGYCLPDGTLIDNIHIYLSGKPWRKYQP